MYDTNEKRRAWRKKNPEKSREYTRRWRNKNREKWREYGRKHRGLPAPTRPCPDLCECCRTALANTLDHDHATGEFRGWLCSKCNSGIGMLGDARHGVGLALAYLDYAERSRK